MLTLIGYGAPLWLFFIGLGGLTTGILPGITVIRRSGWRMKLAGLIMMLPLPLAIWWGYRPTESVVVVDEFQTLDKNARTVISESIDRYRTAQPEESRIRELLDKERQYVEDASRVTVRLSNRLDDLDAYERCFDRLFFCFAGLMFGWAFVPPLRDSATVSV